MVMVFTLEEWAMSTLAQVLQIPWQTRAGEVYSTRSHAWTSRNKRLRLGVRPILLYICSERGKRLKADFCDNSLPKELPWLHFKRHMHSLYFGLTCRFCLIFSIEDRKTLLQYEWGFLMNWINNIVEFAHNKRVIYNLAPQIIDKKLNEWKKGWPSYSIPILTYQECLQYTTQSSRYFI